MTPDRLSLPDCPRLRDAPIELWDVNLEAIPHHQNGVTEDQTEAETRYRRPQDRARYLARRQALREVLSVYVGHPPGALRFRYGAHGQPALDCVGPAFSLAHSRGRALIAVRGSGRVGVDLERVRAGLQIEAIVQEFFRATDWPNGFHASLGPRQFYEKWTQHESLAKATGEGLSIPANREEGTGFQVHHLDLGPDWAAALAWD